MTRRPIAINFSKNLWNALNKETGLKLLDNEQSSPFNTGTILIIPRCGAGTTNLVNTGIRPTLIQAANDEEGVMGQRTWS